MRKKKKGFNPAKIESEFVFFRQLKGKKKKKNEKFELNSPATHLYKRRKKKSS